MNKQTKVIAILCKTAIIALFAVVMLASCQTSPPPGKWADVVYKGEDSLMLEDTRWNYKDSNGNSTYFIFHFGGVSDESYCTWERKDNIVKWTRSVFYDTSDYYGRSKGRYHYTGEFSLETKRITGIREDSYGNEITFVMDLAEGYTLKGLTIQNAVATASNKVTKIFTQNSRIAIIYISSDNKKFTDYVYGELEHIWVNKDYILTNRSEIERLRREQNFQMSGEVEDTTAISIGKIVGADIIITGSVDGEGDLLRLRVRAIETQTARVLVSTSDYFIDDKK
jgi:hypothetical protein